MGILGLSRLISDISPESVKEMDLKSLFGRRIAIDASMCIYQFLIAIRSQEYAMTNDAGETTSHLVGMFYRSIRLMEIGIKPIYVFDGKAPKLKSGELAKRSERRQEAQKALDEAKEVQNVEDIQRFNKRLVRVTGKIISDTKKLLELMGLPVIQALSEAEAQCVQLCKENLVYAVATEDMDALTFGCPRLVRNLTHAGVEKIKEYQVDKVLSGMGLSQEQFIDLSILMGCDYCKNIRGIGGKKGLDLIRKHNTIEGILEEKFGITEFTEVDIEYSNRGKKEEEKKPEEDTDVLKEGEDAEVKEEDQEETDIKKEVTEESQVKKEDEPVVKKEIDEEEFLAQIKTEDDEEAEEEDPSFKEEEDDEDEESKENESQKKKKDTKKGYSVPENWPFRGARKLFQEPLVTRNEYKESDLKLRDIQVDALVAFLCDENGFSEERVRNAIKRAKDAKAKSSQTRIDTFFKMKPSTPAAPTPNKGGQKRGAQDNKKKSTNAKRGRR